MDGRHRLGDRLVGGRAVDAPDVVERAHAHRASGKIVAPGRAHQHLGVLGRSDDVERLGVGVAGRPLIGLGAQNDGLPQPVILGQAFALRPGLGQWRRLRQDRDLLRLSRGVLTAAWFRSRRRRAPAGRGRATSRPRRSRRIRRRPSRECANPTWSCGAGLCSRHSTSRRYRRGEADRPIFLRFA